MNTISSDNTENEESPDRGDRAADERHPLRPGRFAGGPDPGAGGHPVSYTHLWSTAP